MKKDAIKAAMLLTLGLSVACGGGEEAPAAGGEMEMEMESTPEEAPSAGPRVFFVAPRDGAEISVDVPVVFEFGSENFEIAPVPEEAAHPARREWGTTTWGSIPSACPLERSFLRVTRGSTSVTARTRSRCSWSPASTRSRCRSATTSTGRSKGLCETISIELADGI